MVKHKQAGLVSSSRRPNLPDWAARYALPVSYDALRPGIEEADYTLRELTGNPTIDRVPQPILRGSFSLDAPSISISDLDKSTQADVEEVVSAIRAAEPNKPVEADKIAAVMQAFKQGSAKPIDPAQWKDMPHVAFANLRLNEKDSVTGFMRRYGTIGEIDQTKTGGRFTIDGNKLQAYQHILREAWSDPKEKGFIVKWMGGEWGVPPGKTVGPPWGSRNFGRMSGPGCVYFRQQLEAGENNMKMRFGEGHFFLSTTNLWTFIAFLTFTDYKKLGICKNPECPAPYFLTVRGTQKFCSLPCAEYGHRQDALRWWKANRKTKPSKRAPR